MSMRVGLYVCMHVCGVMLWFAMLCYVCMCVVCVPVNACFVCLHMSVYACILCGLNEAGQPRLW